MPTTLQTTTKAPNQPATGQTQANPGNPLTPPVQIVLTPDQVTALVCEIENQIDAIVRSAVAKVLHFTPPVRKQRLTTAERMCQALNDAPTRAKAEPAHPNAQFWALRALTKTELRRTIGNGVRDFDAALAGLLNTQPPICTMLKQVAPNGRVITLVGLL